MDEAPAPLTAKEVRSDDLRWTQDDDEGRKGRILRVHAMDEGVIFGLSSYLIWVSNAQGPYAVAALFFMLLGLVSVYENASKTAQATAIGDGKLHIRTRTKTHALGLPDIHEVRAILHWKYGPRLRIQTSSGQKLEFNALHPRRLEELVKDIESAKRKDLGMLGDSTAAPGLAAAVEGKAAPVVTSWAVCLSPAGELVADGIALPRSNSDASIPKGVWESAHQGQELFIQAFSVVTTFALFTAVFLYVILSQFEITLSRTEFCVAAFLLGAIPAAVLRKRFHVGERGRSVLYFPEPIGQPALVQGMVRRAVSAGGWRIESEEGEDALREWRLDKPIKLIYNQSSQPHRNYLRIETIGRTHRVSHARFKGLFLQELEATRKALPPTTPSSRAAQEGNPPESGGVESPTPAK